MSLTKELDAIVPRHISEMNIVCIGTDRSTGDSLGPMVGLMLQQRGIRNVYGTLHKPVHAVSMEEGILNTLPKRYTLAIDACLGQSSSVGKAICEIGPLKPGAGVGKTLPAVGDAHIKAIVNVGGFMEYFVLQNTRLSLVYDMASQIADAVEHVYKRLRPKWEVDKLNKSQATRLFRQVYPELGTQGKKQDKPMLRQAWNDFKDQLHREAAITTYQANIWQNPFLKKEDR
jgi:putative sporulation protein YyaC